MNYKTLLLDADETLLDFHKAEACAIEATFALHQMPFDTRTLALYSKINQQCWREFEQGLITKETLLYERFRRLFNQLGICADAHKVRITYQEELGKAAYMIDGARQLCCRLAGSHDLYIVTNGVSATQHSRFAKCGLDRIVKGIFVSEDVGFQKPQKEYFEAVFERIPGFEKEKTLLVGDSLTADIQGGINAGVDTCWYNPRHLEKPVNMEITYIIDKITDLEKIV